MTPEQKLKIRKQILADIDRQLDEDEAGEEDQFNKEISDEEDVELDGIYPVSYTHLDVYKRQALYSC